VTDAAADPPEKGVPPGERRGRDLQPRHPVVSSREVRELVCDQRARARTCRPRLRAPARGVAAARHRPTASRLPRRGAPRTRTTPSRAATARDLATQSFAARAPTASRGAGTGRTRRALRAEHDRAPRATRARPASSVRRAHASSRAPSRGARGALGFRVRRAHSPSRLERHRCRSRAARREEGGTLRDLGAVEPRVAAPERQRSSGRAS
jgi:hypothetical protein